VELIRDGEMDILRLFKISSVYNAGVISLWVMVNTIVIAEYAKEWIPTLSLITSIFGIMYHLSNKLSITQCASWLFRIDIISTAIAICLPPIPLIFMSTIFSGFFLLLRYKTDLYIKYHLDDAINIFPTIKSLSGVMAIIITSISIFIFRLPNINYVLLLKLCMVMSLPNCLII
jgi:hypothetical protein